MTAQNACAISRFKVWNPSKKQNCGAGTANSVFFVYVRCIHISHYINELWGVLEVRLEEFLSCLPASNSLKNDHFLKKLKTALNCIASVLNMYFHCLLLGHMDFCILSPEAQPTRLGMGKLLAYKKWLFLCLFGT